MTRAILNRLLLASALTLALIPGAWGQVLELTDAEFVLADAREPPGDTAAWHSQTLPDRWRANHPDAQGNGWYRIRFTMKEPTQSLQAVYLPGLGLNAAVFLNGVPIGDGGSFDEPIARNWNRPLLFVIAPGLLRVGQNTLHVHLRSHPYTQANLEPLVIGPEKTLRPVFERDYFLRITLNQTASVLIVGIGVLMLSLWWRRRRDSYYGYFGLSALIWTVQSANLYLQEVPISTAAWEILANSSVQVFSALLLISLLRFSRVDWKPLVRVLVASVVLAPVTLWLVPVAHFLELTAFWHLFTFFGGAVTLALLLHATLARGNRDARMLVAAMGVVLLLAGHDWLMHSQDFWPLKLNWPLGDVFLLHYSAPVVFMAVGLIMTARFARVLNEFESLNNELETRVQTKHAQLESSFARMRVLETDRAVSEERERIYRDLHDDMGAKLLSLVYRAGNEGNAELARSALQDLRDVVSSTSAGGFVLEEVAADWRAECEQRLTDAAIRLEWRHAGPFAGIGLSQPQALNVGRILREAVSNVIKHSRASNVAVTIDITDARLHLEICDDGVGCNNLAGGSGRGLRNMEERASRLNGKLARSLSPPRGSLIVLDVPLSGASTEPQAT